VPIDRAQYLFHDPVSIFQHVVIPEAYNEVAHRFQDLGSILVALPILIVLPTIDFHDDFHISAQEVDYESVDRHLPFEFPTGKSAIAQAKPQHTLGIRLIAA
jgi:hypothetical protein